jgi:flagellar basal body-associated protein FliL
MRLLWILILTLLILWGGVLVALWIYLFLMKQAADRNRSSSHSDSSESQGDQISNDILEHYYLADYAKIRQCRCTTNMV